MGYTMQGSKIVIWTSSHFVADDYPFQDEGDNYTFFYPNLRSRDEILSCLARLSNEEKIALVAKSMGLEPDKIVLRSKKAHRNQQKRNAIK